MQHLTARRASCPAPRLNEASTDSLRTYFHRSLGFAAIGLVGIGDAYGGSPSRSIEDVRLLDVLTDISGHDTALRVEHGRAHTLVMLVE